MRASPLANPSIPEERTRALVINYECERPRRANPSIPEERTRALVINYECERPRRANLIIPEERTRALVIELGQNAMPDDRDRPREYDAVKGGQNPTPIDAAVLGGISGVKSRLASTILAVRIAALSEALKYGEAGLDLVVRALQDESMQKNWFLRSITDSFHI